jgi:hypothetical protein
LEIFFKEIGQIERIQGEVFLTQNPDILKLAELPSNEAVN